MALFVRQDENRSEYQKKLATELQEKSKQRADVVITPDGVEDSAYMKGTKKTTSLAMVWLLIFFAFAILILSLMLKN